MINVLADMEDRKRRQPGAKGGGNRRYAGTNIGQAILTYGVVIREEKRWVMKDLWEAMDRLLPGWRKLEGFRDITVDSFNTKTYTASDDANLARKKLGKPPHREHPRDRYPLFYAEAIKNVRAGNPMTVQEFIDSILDPENNEPYPRARRHKK